MKQIPINDITRHPKLPYREDLGDMQPLMTSLSKHGQLMSIGVDKQYRLIFGQRRLEGLKRLGKQFVQCEVFDTENPLELMQDENECREQRSPSEKVLIAKLIQEELKAKAEAKVVPGKRLGPAEKKELKETPREQAAKAVGWSKTTLNRAEKILKSGDAKAIEKMETTGQVPVIEKKKPKKPAHISKLFSQLAQAIDDHARAIGRFEGREHKEVTAKLDSATTAFELWVEGKL